MKYKHLHVAYDRDSRTRLVLRSRQPEPEELEAVDEAPPVTAAIEIQQPR